MQKFKHKYSVPISKQIRQRAGDTMELVTRRNKRGGSAQRGNKDNLAKDKGKQVSIYQIALSGQWRGGGGGGGGQQI